MKLLDHLHDTLPKFKVTIPSTKTETFFRPFLVKEEKTLLLTQDEGDTTILNAMAKIVESCVDNVSNGYQIPMCDLEYLFCMLRAKSVSETATPTFICPDTGETIKVGVNLTELDIDSPEVNNEVLINDEFKIILKTPVVADYINLDSDKATESLIARCIDRIIIKDEVYEGSDLTIEEKIELVENLTHKQYEDVSHFVENQPKVFKEISYKTKQDDEIRTLRLEGISDFFV